MPKKILFFFTFSRLICQRQNFLVYASPETLSDDFNVFRVASIIAGKSLPGAQSTQATRFLSISAATTLLSLIAGMFSFFGPIIYPGIRPDPETGPPFYIKRLAGLPGDTLRIDPPFLYVNGKKAEGFGFERVMSAKPPYRGYALGKEYLSQPDRTYTVPKDGYFALGETATTASTAVTGDRFLSKTWSGAACWSIGRFTHTGV